LSEIGGGAAETDIHNFLKNIPFFFRQDLSRGIGHRSGRWRDGGLNPGQDIRYCLLGRGLPHHGKGSQGHNRLDRLRLHIGAANDNERFRPYSLHPFQSVNAVHNRHGEIDKGDVWVGGLELLQTAQSVSGLEEIEGAVLGHTTAKDLPRHRGIVDNEDFFYHGVFASTSFHGEYQSSCYYGRLTRCVQLNGYEITFMCVDNTGRNRASQESFLSWEFFYH